MSAPPPSANRSRWLLLVTGGCALLLACAVLAAAGGGLFFLRGRAPAAAQPNVEYVLDASPRMLEDNGGATRLSVAQGVLAEIVRPASANVSAGLRVFGSGAGQQAGACQDTALLVPLAPANQAAISDRVETVQGGTGANADAALGTATVDAIRDLAATTGKHALVVVTGGDDSCNPQAGQLVAQEAARQHIDLQLFVVGFQVTDADGVGLKGLVDQTSGATYMKADNADQLRQTLAAIQTFVDRPNGLSVANVVATSGAPSGTPAAAGSPPAGPTPTALNTGVLQVNVLAYAGQPAATNDRLIVYAYSPQDHQTILGTDYANPSALRLPAGRYDLNVTYDVVQSSPYIGGKVSQWLTGLEVQSGLTTTTTYDMKLGQVALTMLEAARKPVPDGNYSFGIRIYPANDMNNAAAWVIVTTTATLQLAPGAYVVDTQYPGVNSSAMNASPLRFEVQAGQSLAYTFNLKLGHVVVTVNDANGKPLDPAQVTSYAFPVSDPNTYFSVAYGTNPADLPVQGGASYNLELRLGDGRKLTLANQQVAEGETRPVTVSESDFK